MNHEYLSDKTRSFRKGVLTFSAFLVLAISYDLKVTEIPSLGIEKIDPNIVFTGNVVALTYLFVSYMFYYLQDRVHHNRFNLAIDFKQKGTERINKYIASVNGYIDKQFQQSIQNSILDPDITIAKSHILRIMMKDHIDNQSSRAAIEKIIQNLATQKQLNLSTARICSDLSDERSNYLSGKDKSFSLEAKQITVDSVVGVWDFWVPIMSAVLAFAIFILKA